MKFRTSLLCLLLLFGAMDVPARVRNAQRAPARRLSPAALARKINAIVSDPAVSHAHWGISVKTLSGEPIYALNDAQFFAPASNAKIFTTAAAFALLPTHATFVTNVVTDGMLNPDGHLHGNLIVLGAGDGNMSGRTLPYTNKTERANPPLAALSEMADQIVRSGVHAIDGDIVGDDSWFVYERYGAGWAWDDLQWLYGAPVSALTVNDNAVFLNVVPGTSASDAVVASWNPTTAYYTLENSIMPAPANTAARPGVERLPGSMNVRAFGTIGSNGLHAGLAIEDPAAYAALSLKEMLRDRGVQVSGTARPVHRIPSNTADFRSTVQQPLPLTPTALSIIQAPTLGRRVMASHVSAPMLQDLVVVNKVSQNLHAELLLRLLGQLVGADGTIAEGVRVVRQFLIQAGVRPDDFNFYDGSGMSPEDMVTPRAATSLLTYAALQPWGADFRSTFPIGGVDGSLAGRFLHTALQGKVFAKTGTLAEVNSLSGYVTAASGRTLVVSIFCNERVPSSEAERQAIDKIVELIGQAE